MVCWWGSQAVGQIPYTEHHWDSHLQPLCSCPHYTWLSSASDACHAGVGEELSVKEMGYPTMTLALLLSCCKSQFLQLGSAGAGANDPYKPPWTWFSGSYRPQLCVLEGGLNKCSSSQGLSKPPPPHTHSPPFCLRSWRVGTHLLLSSSLPCRPVGDYSDSRTVPAQPTLESLLLFHLVHDSRVHGT